MVYTNTKPAEYSSKNQYLPFNSSQCVLSIHQYRSHQPLSSGQHGPAQHLKGISSADCDQAFVCRFQSSAAAQVADCDQAFVCRFQSSAAAQVDNRYNQ